jgi:hypothetical protein
MGDRACPPVHVQQRQEGIFDAVQRGINPNMLAPLPFDERDHSLIGIQQVSPVSEIERIPLLREKIEHPAKYKWA